MVSIKELAKRSPKKCWSKVDATWHYLGLYTARPLLKTNITPNQITLFWIFLELFAAALLLGSYYQRVIGIIIFNFAVNLLDFTDGNVARIKNIKSFRGLYLEHVGIFLGMPIMLLCLGVGIFLRTDNLLALFLGGLTCIFMLLEKLANVNGSWYGPEHWEKMKAVYKSSSFSKKGIVSYASELFRRTQPFNVLFFGILFNYLFETLAIYTIIAFLFMLYKYYSQNRAIMKLDRT